MNDCFSPGAARLAGIVPRLLLWPPGRFWNATPTELAAILAPETAPPGTGPGLGHPPPLTREELNRLMERQGDG